MAKLKELRKVRGISQLDLAEAVGVSRQTVSKWENGIIQPSANNLVRLSQVLQFPLEAFLRDDWKLPEPDLAPAAPPAEVPQIPADEVPPPRRRNYRLLAALVAVLAAIGIVAGVISFNGRGDDMPPIEETEIEEEEVDQFPSMSVTLHP